MKHLKYVLPFLCLSPFIAHSEIMNGNELLLKLTQQDSSGFLYLVGIVDAADASRLIFETNVIATSENTRVEAKASLGKYWGCKPEKASYGQVSDIAISYLKNHPKVRHLEASMLIAAAMREAWPCK